MAQAACNVGVDPRGLSFKHTVQLWTEWVLRGLSATKDCERLFTLPNPGSAIGPDASSHECENEGPNPTPG